MEPANFVETRTALHAVAEHVLAAARHRATGRIGLQVSPDGFTTPPFGPDEQVVAIRGGQIVVADRRDERSAALTTLGAAAAFAGIEPGAPAGVYLPATACEPDAPLRIDPEAAAAITGWYASVSAALREFAPQAAQTLWPEHFDVAIRLDDTNFGGLAGDTGVADPYVYVGPAHVPAGDAFFDRPFGAARTWTQVASVAAIVGFFRDGARQARQLSARA